MATLYDDIEYLPANVAVAQLQFLQPLSADQSTDVTQVLTSAVKQIDLYPQQMLYDQDAPLTHVWVLVSGKVSQVRRDRDAQGRARQSLQREAGPGTLLGAYDYLFDKVYRTRTRAIEQCTLIALEITALSRLIFRFPAIRDRMAPTERMRRLRSFPILAPVDLVGLGYIADALHVQPMAAGETLYNSGDNVENVYLLSQGQVELRWDEGETNWLGNGATFGLAHGVGLLGAAEARVMEHSARTTLPGTLFDLPQATFAALTGFAPDSLGLAEMAQREQVIADLAIFAAFTPKQRKWLTGYCSHYYLPQTHLLIQQGEEADSLWILMPGGTATIRALDSRGQVMPSTNTQGPTHFGETALLGQIPQSSTVEADADSFWLRLHWRDFEHQDQIDPADLRAMLQVSVPPKTAVVSKDAKRKFPWLQPGESVVYFSRRHWIAYFRKNAVTFVVLGLLLLTLLIGWLIPGTQWFFYVLVIFLIVLAVAALVWGTIDYRNDWLVVTNRRVVYQEKLLFVRQWRKEAPLEQIQNVDYRKTFIGRMLNFGTLIIQTAGTGGTITFDYTTNFETLRQIVTSQQSQRKQHATAKSKLQIHRELEGRLGVEIELPSKVYTGPDIPTQQTTRWQARLAAGVSAQRTGNDTVVWRKHWMALVPQLSWAWLILLVLGLITLVFWLNTSTAIPDEWHTAYPWVQALGLVMLGVFLARLGWVVVDWYNDTYEVSNTQVVNLRKLPFGLREDRRAAAIERIQNVEMIVPSPIHWLFDYGTVICQTAAEDGGLVFYAVPDPKAVSAEILARMQRAQRRNEEEDLKRRTQELPDWFEMYNRIEVGSDGRNGA